jgi:Tol biopolymer transport system component
MVLRDALGDSADQPRYIEGLRGQGYRLIPEVQAASTHGLPDRLSIGASMVTPYFPVPRAKHLTSRKLIYAVASALSLTVAVIGVDSYLRGTATDAVGRASSASPASELPLTFVVHAPEGSSFGLAPANPVPALSPDGTQLAFVAPWESISIVWVQRLGSPEARPLAGTSGADAPFWSPDGKFIAFGSEGRLKRIAATGGGAPREITVTDEGYRSGTWSADDTIVFAGNAGLYRVPADGGEAKLLTRIDDTRGEFSHRFPVMLPDGTRFVYLVLSKQDDHTGLYLGSLDDPEMKVRLLPDDSNAAFGLGPSGQLHLLFVRNSVLLAQPFDASRGALTGDPVVIAEPIDQAPTVRFAAFAASGRALVYRPRFTPSNQLVWIDRGGIRGQVVGPESRRWRFPVLSRDGTKLAALREDRSDVAGLWWFDLRRGISEPLSRGSWVGERSGGALALMSAWTPDGNHIVYSAAQPGGWAIYRRSLTGVDAESLFAGPIPELKRVRGVTEDAVLFQDDNFELWVLPLAGKQQPYRLPIEGRKNHVRVSPDGRWLAFTLTEGSRTEVYVTAFPVPAERWRISTAGGSDPQWRHDGRELYYVAADQTLMAISVETGTTFNATTPKPLFRASLDRTSLEFGSAYVPAPDGQQFLVVEITGDDEPYLIAMLNWTPRRHALD